MYAEDDEVDEDEDEGRRTKDEEFFFEGCAATPLEAIRSNVMQASSLLWRKPLRQFLRVFLVPGSRACQAIAARRAVGGKPRPAETQAEP